jgi:hypothetical protein
VLLDLGLLAIDSTPPHQAQLLGEVYIAVGEAHFRWAPRKRERVGERKTERQRERVRGRERPHPAVARHLVSSRLCLRHFLSPPARNQTRRWCG